MSNYKVQILSWKWVLNISNFLSFTEYWLCHEHLITDILILYWVLKILSNYWVLNLVNVLFLLWVLNKPIFFLMLECMNYSISQFFYHLLSIEVVLNTRLLILLEKRDIDFTCLLIYSIYVNEYVSIEYLMKVWKVSTQWIFRFA